MQCGKSEDEPLIGIHLWHKTMVACFPNFQKTKVVVNIGGRLGAGKMLERSSARVPKTGTRT
jgi:hypothetical protein